MGLPETMANLEPTFADPAAALVAKHVFVTRASVQFNRWDTYTGHVVPNLAREALISGMDYWWERRSNHLVVHKALIWRTTADDTSLQGASGSALCLGDPNGGSCQVVAFQNYESRYGENRFFEKDPTRPNDYTAMQPRACVKGAFLLPLEIQGGRIITPREAFKRRSVSGPILGRDTAVDTQGLRQVSGPPL